MASYNGPTEEGSILSMAYTGTVDMVEIQTSGLYLVSVIGGSGSGYVPYGACACGGYSSGKIQLKKGQTIYVCIGGSGSGRSFESRWVPNGGYNGGGSSGGGNNEKDGGYSGAGATHMAFVGGTLANIGYTSFVTNKNGIIVAGGSGGGVKCSGQSTRGDGGGLNGVNGYNTESGRTAGYGGSQTAGGGGSTPGSFGQGGAATGVYGTFHGGGGGLFGGGGTDGYSAHAGGGSGYLSSWLTDGVSFPYEDNVGKAVHGSAYIKLLEITSPPIIFDGITITKIIYNGIELQ